MSDNAFRIRVFFELKGRLSMLSHLELARALERMVRRANLPYAISQGFSPHMKIAFGSALPVGIGGLKECFDLQITNYIAPEKIQDALGAECMPDLNVLSVSYIDKRAPAASVAFPVSCYCVEFAQTVAEIAIPDSITVIRKRKERKLIISDYLAEDPLIEGNKITFTLLAKSTGSLRADVFVKSLFDQVSQPAIKSFLRTDQKTS